MAQDFLKHGRSEAFNDGPLPYSEIQDLFAGLTNA
jgi:hypothetical protein